MFKCLSGGGGKGWGGGRENPRENGGKIEKTAQKGGGPGGKGEIKVKRVKTSLSWR